MTTRDRIILIVLAAVGVLVGCWMLAIAPRRTQAAKLSKQVQTLQGQVSTAQSQISQDLAARASFAADYAQLARLGEALPSDDNMPSLIYQLQSAASGAGVDFRTLQLVPGSSTATPATGSSSSTSSSSSSTSSSSSATSSGSNATGSGASASTLPPGAAMGTAGFPTDQFSFTFSGDFFHLATFFSRLQNFVVATARRIAVSGRLLSVNAITLAPSTAGFPHITATVSATSYMAPASTGLLDGATRAGPAGTTTAPATGSSVASATITPTLR